MLLAQLVATASSGGDWPDGSRCAPGNVLLMTSEDDPSVILKPRLVAAGADLARVRLLKGTLHPETGRLQSVTLRDLDSIREAATEMGGIDMLCIDVLNSFIGGGIDTHRDADLRQVLDPLNELASELNAVVLANTHLNKNSGVRRVLHRIIGSVAYVGTARDVWAVIPTEEGVSWVNTKRNFAELAGGWKYQIEGVQLDIDDETVDVGRIRWNGREGQGADEILARSEAVVGDDEGAVEEAMRWLRGQLEDGRKRPKDLFREAKADGISAATLRRAKDHLGVVSRKDGMRGGWAWSMPDGTFSHEGDHEDAQTRGN